MSALLSILLSASLSVLIPGRAITSLGQALDTWTNALLRMDLSQPWSTGAPPLELVFADRNTSSAPPQVALGQFWSSKDGSSLYQTAGQYSDSPPVEPRENKLWKYDIPGNDWSTIETSGEELLGSAEGATALAPDVGTNGEPVIYQFGGHLDVFTTPNWPGSRVYLSSMTTFDTGSSQTWNITTFEGTGDSGSRNSTTTTTPPLLRADSTLTYVPNLGTDNKGVLVSIGGGNLDKVLDNSVLDIFDIGANTFVKQATQGDIMQPRVNHCAVRVRSGSAIVNGVEQHHIFVYGGHAANRTTQIREGQFSDVYILTLPSYTWTYVGAELASQPVPRAGHTCELLGDQMISIGGYISEDIMCEQPGIYLFNTTSLSWATDYVPNQQFTTPTLLRNLTGGQGSSNSTGGSGWQNPKEVYTATVTAGEAGATSTTTQTAELQNGENKSKLGPILGGVAGGLTLAFLVLFLINFFAKRQRRREHAKWKYQMFPDGAWSADDDDAASLQAMAYNDVRPVGKVGAVAMAPLDSPVHSRPYSHEHSNSQTSQDSWSANRASDEVESATEGMQVSGLSHLAPRETLRVTNPSDRSIRSLSYSATQRSGNSLL